jgi:formate dehydrogenase iron-sulfur subunit
MTYQVFIPKDSSALSVGADKVALAIALEAQKRGIAINIVRNGSRGLYWLETLVEVETSHGRMG